MHENLEYLRGELAAIQSYGPALGKFADRAQSLTLEKLESR